MKIRGAKQVHYDSGPNMTPLVDIVLVILIFFMLVGSFSTAEHYLVSNVPVQAKGAGGPPPPGAIIPKRFTIVVRQEGPIFVARAGNFALVRSSDPDQLYTALKRDLGAQVRLFRAAGVNPTDVQVIIYPTASTVLDGLVPCMEAAQAAGFTNVGFGVNETG